MDENILKLIQLANYVYKTNPKIYIHIEYYADEREKLVISIINKSNCAIIESLRVDLFNNPQFNWNTFFDTLKCYAGGVTNE